jgi:hypothetical protein
MEISETTNNAPELIQKENVPDFSFVSYDVLDNIEERGLRALDLQKAMVLGNGDHVKISISFLTTDGMKKVETTVWAATEESIMLKGGVSIPVHCIKEIKLI